MQFEHRVGIHLTPEQKEKLMGLGVTIHESSSPLVKGVVLQITEDHPGWSYVKTLIRPRQSSDMSGTLFSKPEFDAAPFLKLEPGFAHGYPYPRPGNFGFLDATYDPNSRCPGNPVGVGVQRTGLCGMGMIQVAPFQMKAEPKWGKRHIMQLNWVFDEFFVRPEIWQKVFKPLGIEFEWVLHYKTLKKLETVVQLKVEHTAQSPLVIPEKHTKETCTVCGRTRYHPWVRGFFPSFRESPGAGHIWKTQEIFGSGGSAWNAVIISATLYQEIQRHKLQGVTFMPMAPERSDVAPLEK